jgi:hypothetical protein
MKRFLTIIFAFLYLSLTIGASFDVHYCGGNIQSVKINAENIKSCCGDDESETAGCCSNRSYFVQLDVEQEINYQDIVFYIFKSNVIVNDFLVDFISTSDKEEYYYEYTPPNTVKKFILFSSLTYYG